MRSIKLMPDYHCFPLWGVAKEDIGDIDPSTLPISDDLKEQLQRWADIYDATLNLEHPLESGFPDANAEDAFKLQGHLLARRLQTELGAEYEVIDKSEFL